MLPLSAPCRLCTTSFLLLMCSLTTHAQVPAPSDTEASHAEKPVYRPLPLGVFRGSLPPSKTDPALVEAMQNDHEAVVRGESLLKLGHANDAVAEFQTALNYLPADGTAYQRLAEAYTVLGKLKEASQSFHKVLVEGFGPGVSSGVGANADIWAEYALVLVKTHQPAEAVQMYNHAAYMLDYEDSEHYGGKPTLKVLFPEVVMGNALPEQVQYTPEHLQALADSLLAYEQQGFWSEKEVLSHAQEAVKLYPDSGVTHYYRGEVLSGPGHSAEAKAEYQKAIDLGDDRTVSAAKERLTQ